MSTDASVADQLPPVEEISPIYDRLLELAGEHLARPVTATVDTWEDGTFRIRVFHHYAGTDNRETLYYHSAEGAVRYGVEGDDTLTDERVVARIDAPEGDASG